MSRARHLVVLLALIASIAGAALLFACSQTPTSVPIRTFERAQKVDVICLRLDGPNAPEGLKQEECPPVPPRADGSSLPNQLFALVTQTTRGEVAVVNLSAGDIVDQSDGLPGRNFLPVGANPTDIATTPDGRMAFVSSAEPNKFAIYGIPGHRILGDKAPGGLLREPATLTSWPVCSLPQRPGSLTVVPRRASPGAADAGATAPAAPGDVPYELVAVLPGDRTTPAKVITIDPRPFLRAAPRRLPSGEAIDDFGEGPVLAPGQLNPCPITSAIELAGESAIPATFRPGKRWDDGVKWVDGGVDLSCETPEKPSRCGLRPCTCNDPTTGKVLGAPAITDGGALEVDGGACEPDAGRPDPDDRERDFELGPLDPPQPVAIARDDQTLFVADDGVPLIHVIDLSVPGSPRELAPFVMSSVVEPSRVVSIRSIAVSPPTREYKRYLYAVDRKQGSIAVFDVTDVATAERTPMRRPHPELNPFQPPDRLAFIAPVVSVAFARNDFPLSRIGNRDLASAATGVLCNPNPNAAPSVAGADAPDLGFYYRASSPVPGGLGPRRLRGIFAFATLSDGKVVGIDVDDWDAPCRRPQTLTGIPESSEGVGVSIPVLASVPQPAPGPGDLDPYHAPVAPPESVSQELFFPVSAPHEPRSSFLLRDDATSGKHIPYLTSAPTLSSTQGVSPALTGPGSETSPKIRPTAFRAGGSATGTEEIGVRISLDDPHVHYNQDWTITYEGRLPGFEGLPATISTTDGYSSLILSQPQARFCAKGVEDWAVGGERANAITNALAKAGRPQYSERIDRRMVDYVQVTDDLLPASDPYWRQEDLEAPNSCWDDRLNEPDPASPETMVSPNAARLRFEQCTGFFGPASEQSGNRDFPILEAYDDRLVIGRFHDFSAREQDPPFTREVVWVDPSNATSLKLMRCCFHHQVKFAVRAGSQWVTTGSLVGLLNHVTRGEDGRCITSCEPAEALLNSRAPSLPSAEIGGVDFAPFRDSPLAMRNPAFSFFIQNGRDVTKSPPRDKLPVRDMAFGFQTRGEFQPLIINLAATTSAVNPQSMKFIESLGQLAVVDGSSQGLVLIDLAGVAIARAPYF